MIYGSYYLILLVMLELIQLLNGKPHNSKSFLHESAFNSPASDYLSARQRRDVGEGNLTKAERILNTSNQRGPVSFGEFSEQDIIFPDSFEVTFQPVPRIDGAPKCAASSTFCEDFEAYPYLHLRDILRTQNVNKEFFFGEDEMPPELEKRIGADEETFVCGAVDRIIFPKIGKNKNDEWKYIVNQGKNDDYVQGVRIETCRHQDEPCDIIGELPEGFRTSCKQKYIYRKLMSLNENGTPMPDTFPMPSACCCSYKRDVGFLSRFGRSVTPIK